MLEELGRLQGLLGFRARGVIHVGAHTGNEQAVYDRLGIADQVWIEPHPDSFRRLRERVQEGPRVHLLNVACGSKAGRVPMFVTTGNEGASNSLLKPTGHLNEFPGIKPTGTIDVEVRPLDECLGGIDTGALNLLVMDTQGFELEVLRGGVATLRGIDAVVCEVARAPLYAGGCRVGQVDEFLAAQGFERVLTEWVARSYGDALYLRRGAVGLVRRAAAVPALSLRFRARAARANLRPAMLERMRRARLRAALKLVGDGPVRGIVLDASDGVPLDDLAARWERVVATDANADWCQTTEDMAADRGQPNVRAVCTAGRSLPQVRELVRDEGLGVLLLLERLEHIGEPGRAYEARIEHLLECLSLLKPGGVVVLSVPKMVGPGFVAKYLVQRALGLVTEKQSARELWRAGVLRDVSALEPRWNGGHAGFSHLRLEEAMRGRIEIVRKRATWASVFYAVRGV